MTGIKELHNPLPVQDQFQNILCASGQCDLVAWIHRIPDLYYWRVNLANPGYRTVPLGPLIKLISFLSALSCWDFTGYHVSYHNWKQDRAFGSLFLFLPLPRCHYIDRNRTCCMKWGTSLFTHFLLSQMCFMLLEAGTISLIIIFQ